MDERVCKRMRKLFYLAYNDEKYNRLRERLADQEIGYENAMKNLTASQYEISCEYYSIHSEMTARMLEIACENFCLPEE